MRHGRAKAARKTLQHFRRTIGLVPPYNILLDATFVVALFQQKILPIATRIDRVLCHHQPGGHVHVVAKSSGGGLGSKTRNSNLPPKTNKYFMTQAALEELHQIHHALLQQQQHQQQNSKHGEKSLIFQQALEWIQKECHILHRTPTQQEQQHSPESTTNPDASSKQFHKSKSTTRKTANNALSTPALEDLLYHLRPQQSQQTGLQHPPLQPEAQNNNNNNNNKSLLFVVASQDESLLHELRQWGTVPIIRLVNHNSVLLLEPPSRQSQYQSKGEEFQKWHQALPDAERALVELARQQQKLPNQPQHHDNTSIAAAASAAAAPPPPPLHRPLKKPKAKGPNPLSCKRKRPNDDESKNTANSKNGKSHPAAEQESASKKRRRRAANKKTKTHNENNNYNMDDRGGSVTKISKENE